MDEEHRQGERLGKRSGRDDADADAGAGNANKSGLLEPIQIQIVAKHAGIGLHHQPPPEPAKEVEDQAEMTAKTLQQIEKKTSAFRGQQMLDHHLRQLQRDTGASRRIIQDLDEKHVQLSIALLFSYLISYNVWLTP